MAAIAALTLGSIGTVTGKNAPARRAAPVNAAEYNAGSARTTSVPVAPGGAGGGHRRGRQRCGAPGGGRVAATQPGAGDYRGRQRRADGRGQRI
jgi:hypothetical protein